MAWLPVISCETIQMKFQPILFVAAALLVAAAWSQTPSGRPRGGGFIHPDPVKFDDHAGWTSLFDGKTLNGWSGDSNWIVENGAIVI